METKTIKEAKRTTKETSRRTQSKGVNIGLWILQAILGAMFLMAGISKLIGVSEMVALFENIGIGQWFRYLTAVLEIVAAILLVVPSLAAAGAVLLSGIMLGAVFTHLFVIGGSEAMAGIYLVLSIVVAWGRWNRTSYFLQIKF